MPITLDEPRQAGLPVVKRTAIGQTFNGAVIRVEARDRLKKADDGSMKPIVKPNGKNRQELVVTALTLDGTTSPAGLGDSEAVPAAGELVRLILKGKAFGDWIDAKNALGRGVNVGDLVSQTTTTAQAYDAEGNPKGAELTTQEQVNGVPRNTALGIYGPLTLTPASDPEVTAQAEAAYHSLKAPIAASDVPDEEPF